MTLHFIIIVTVVIIVAAAVVVVVDDDVTVDIIHPTISITVITTTPLVLYFLNNTVKVSKNVLYASAFLYKFL